VRSAWRGEGMPRYRVSTGTLHCLRGQRSNLCVRECGKEEGKEGFTLSVTEGTARPK
jgi:hypothetical protein